MRAIDKRTALFKEDIFIFAFFFSTKHRELAISKEFVINGKLDEMIVNVSIKFGHSLFQSQNPYDSNESHGEQFWTAIPVSSIRSMALRVINTIPHSVGCERLFSRLAYIKYKWQNRMCSDTLTGLAQIKMQLKKDIRKEEQQKTPSTIEIDQFDSGDMTGYEQELQELGAIELPEERELQLNMDDGSIESLFDINIEDFVASRAKTPEPVEGDTFNYDAQAVLDLLRQRN